VFGIQRLTRRFIRFIATELATLIERERSVIATRTLPTFGNTPKDLVIELPRRINNPKSIFIGDNVRLGPGTLLNPVMRYPSIAVRHPEKCEKAQAFKPRIIVGNRVVATGHLTIGAVKEVIIEDDVLFASNVTILDNFHGYESPDEPYKYQPLTRIASVLIKRGCWIGENVVIFPGVTIGEMVIIGANSVVTKSIPDKCIAFGAPARVNKIWDQGAKQWITYQNSKTLPA